MASVSMNGIQAQLVNPVKVYNADLKNKGGRPTMPPMGELGTFIRNRRKELHLTLEELADQIGISQQAISQIELGQRHGMKITTARRMARALEVTTDELLERVPDTVAV